MTEEVKKAEEKKAEEKKDSSVIDVEKAEDWTEAEQVADVRWIPTANGEKHFRLRALSYGEENDLYREVPEPQVPLIKRRGQNIPNPEDPNYQKEQDSGTAHQECAYH